MVFRQDEPCFTISIVARRVGVHAQTLRYYEREGLIEPTRSRGNRRLYSLRDVERIQQIKRWVDELGLNLAGVVAITRLRAKVAELESEVARLRRELAALKSGGAAFRIVEGEHVADADLES